MPVQIVSQPISEKQKKIAWTVAESRESHNSFVVAVQPYNSIYKNV